MKNLKLTFFIIAGFLFSCDSDNEQVEDIQTTISISDFSVTIDENPNPESFVGVIEASTNEGSLIYSITEQSPNDAITINPSSGEITVLTESLFDFEINPIISGAVRIQNGTISDMASITINLNDIDETNDGVLVQSLFEWPLKQSTDFDDYSYYYLSNYVDHDPTSGVLDYNGGDRTYNSHDGTDIVVYPFWWKKQNENQVEVVAAANGIIISKDDGHFDQSCEWTGGSWNHVKVEHEDGTTTHYGHLKKNSVTSKLVGQSVVAGEFLGFVGSSGNSTVPHLHFEVRSSDGDLIDPFEGSQNQTITSSMWVNQPEYYDSGINKIVISSILPDVTGDNCPDIEQTNDKFNFYSGDDIIFTRYYRHSVLDQLTTCKIYKPDGSIWDSWSHNHTATRKGRHSWNTRTLPSNAQNGVWTFEAVYLNNVYIKTFNVNN